MLDHQTFATLDPLVDQVLDLPVAEREQFLERLKSDRPRLAVELIRLLDRLEVAEDFLGGDAERARDEILLQSLDSLRASGDGSDMQAGDKLGPYRIERVIGRGLRATVYLATREEEGWRQQVAIKLMARGVDTDDVLRRFFAERQILTELRYPGICTLLDGGLSSDGLPYFVMEHIDGVSITDYCRNHALGLRERVRLFGEVCEAVSQAHRHLVVHRDIKPGNIMVTRLGQVKLLDFGIAKLLEPDQVGTAAVTQVDARPMTPAYASPEQQAGEPITTATDVYQLGLLLAEMLSGLGSPLELLGIEPGSPPARELGRVAGMDGAGLPYAKTALRGDLEWIVLKCLEPDPSSRYGSAEELRTDIVRYLENQPVLARRATFPYLAHKFIRRRPGLALSGAVALIATVVIVALLGYFNINLGRERAAAEEAAMRAEEVKDLLVRILSSADPYHGSGADTRVSELLAGSEQMVDEELGRRPELQAELFGTLADVYHGLSMPEQSARLRERQLALLVQRSGPGTFEALQARRKLALSQRATKGAEATQNSLESLLATLIEQYPGQWLERAKINLDLGNLLHVYGRDEDAVQYANRAVTILRQSADSPADLADSLALLGSVSRDKEEALSYYREADELLSGYRGSEHPSTLSAQVSVASTLSDLARYEESLAIFDRVIPIMERELGPLHDQTLVAMNNRAVCNSRMGKPEAAIAEFREVLARDRQKRGSEHREIGDRLQNLGAMLNRTGHYQEAIEALTEAARIYASVNLPGNPATAFPHITLADTYAKLGEVDLLEFHARKALELLQGNLPDDHPAALKSRCLLGDALIRQGLRSEGTATVQAVLENLNAKRQVNSPLFEQCSALLAVAQ